MASPPTRAELDAIGTGEPPASMSGKARTSLGLGKRSPQADYEEADIATRIEKLWLCSMLPESGVLKAAFDQGIKALKFEDRKDLERVRLRLYRAKRLLQRDGNHYVDILTFSVEPDNILVIEHSENLTKYEVTDEAILQSLKARRKGKGKG